MEKIDLRVANLDCEHDAAAITRGLQGVAGLGAVRVFPKSAKVSIAYDASITQVSEITSKLASLGFPAQQERALPEQPSLWRNPKVITSAASGVLLALGWLVGRAGAPDPAPAVIFFCAIVIGGYYFGREAVEDLIFERRIGTEMLMGVAAVVAFVMGERMDGAMLVFLYSISEAAEGYTENKTRSAIKALMSLTPKTALVRRDGNEQTITVEDVRVGDVFIVRPGQAIATDGIVRTGVSEVNQAPITGESMPVAKEAGDSVFAGSINGNGALEIEASKTFADNTIARIIHMTEEAQERKGQSERFIDAFGARYSPVVLAIGLLVAIVPPLLDAGSWQTWITRATVFIVAAAPCALVISIPISLAAALGTAARQGILIKGGVFIERLAQVRVVALDKTGTLTTGEPSVTDVVPISASGDHAPHADLLALAAGIEQRSEHPLARAIVRHAAGLGVAPLVVRDFQALPGAGASAVLDDAPVFVGSPAMFGQQLQDNRTAAAAVARLESAGKTVVAVGDAVSVWGLIGMSDTVRSDARQAVQALRAVGVEKIVMLTGDNARAAQAIAQEVGIDEVYADLKPEDKAATVRRLTQQYGHVAMVGDGVNDAPALAEATVGVTLGAAGTDVALETADIALMGDRLERLAYAVHLAQRNQRIVTQNLVLSALVIGSLVLGAVLGLLTLPIAVVGHEVSEWVVIGNGLRMLRD